MIGKSPALPPPNGTSPHHGELAVCPMEATTSDLPQHHQQHCFTSAAGVPALDVREIMGKMMENPWSASEMMGQLWEKGLMGLMNPTQGCFKLFL